MSRVEEQKHLEFFESSFAGFPCGTIDKKGERPDWVVHAREGRVGIEHTRLHLHAPNLVARARERERVVEEARAYAERLLCPPLNVAVQFRMNTDVSAYGRTSLACTIADLVLKNIPEATHAVSVKALPDPLINVFIHRAASGKRHLWQSDKVGIIAEDFSARVQSILDHKALKFPTYISRCDECWLIIVADGGSPSSYVEMGGATRTATFVSPFSRAFVLEWLTGIQFELVQAASK